MQKLTLLARLNHHLISLKKGGGFNLVSVGNIGQF